MLAYAAGIPSPVSALFQWLFGCDLSKTINTNSSAEKNLQLPTMKLYHM